MVSFFKASPFANYFDSASFKLPLLFNIVDTNQERSLPHTEQKHSPKQRSHCHFANAFSANLIPSLTPQSCGSAFSANAASRSL